MTHSDAAGPHKSHTQQASPLPPVHPPLGLPSRPSKMWLAATGSQISSPSGGGHPGVCCGATDACAVTARCRRCRNSGAGIRGLCLDRQQQAARIASGLRVQPAHESLIPGVRPPRRRLAMRPLRGTATRPTLRASRDAPRKRGPPPFRKSVGVPPASVAANAPPPLRAAGAERSPDASDAMRHSVSSARQQPLNTGGRRFAKDFDTRHNCGDCGADLGAPAGL